MPRITNKDLQAAFTLYNERFFDNRISKRYKILFKDMPDDDGYHIVGDQEIWINSDFRRHPDIATFVLIHEMAHADLPEYIGAPGSDQHGMRHHAKLDELYKMGAYDGLL